MGNADHTVRCTTWHSNLLTSNGVLFASEPNAFVSAMRLNIDLLEGLLSPIYQLQSCSVTNMLPSGERQRSVYCLHTSPDMSTDSYLEDYYSSPFIQ